MPPTQVLLNSAETKAHDGISNYGVGTTEPSSEVGLKGLWPPLPFPGIWKFRKENRKKNSQSISITGTAFCSITEIVKVLILDEKDYLFKCNNPPDLKT